MRTVLLTGATGFVGRQILNAFSKSGVYVVPVVRAGKEGELARFENVKSVLSSDNIFLESADWWEGNCEGIEIIVHAAWYAEPGKYLTSSLNTECLIGSLNLAKGAVAAGVKRFVGIGSCFEYDLSFGALSIDTPIKPLTPYASAKAALYYGLFNWLHEQSVDFAWCRIFYLFGDAEDERRLVPYIRRQLESNETVELGSGDQIRDYLDVSEAGQMIAEVSLSCRKGAVNICSGVPVTIRQLAEKIADEYGRRDLLKFGSKSINHFDPPCVLGI